jgi:hypothetical protein
MMPTDDARHAPDEPVADAAGRKPYEAPRILSREPLEAVAALCSPTPPAKANLGLCPQGPISS